MPLDETGCGSHIEGRMPPGSKAMMTPLTNTKSWLDRECEASSHWALAIGGLLYWVLVPGCCACVSSVVNS